MRMLLFWLQSLALLLLLPLLSSGRSSFTTLLVKLRLKPKNGQDLWKPGAIPVLSQKKKLCWTQHRMRWFPSKAKHPYKSYVFCWFNINSHLSTGSEDTMFEPSPIAQQLTWIHPVLQNRLAKSQNALTVQQALLTEQQANTGTANTCHTPHISSSRKIPG